MSKPTHKMVNGKRVDLSPEQIEKCEADWALGRAKIARRKAHKIQRQSDRALLLERLSISEEEAKLLMEEG